MVGVRQEIDDERKNVSYSLTIFNGRDDVLVQ